MPLHDWSDEGKWENFHNYWLIRLADALHPLLPEGFQVVTSSSARIGLVACKPDFGVTNALPSPNLRAGGDVQPAEGLEPDEEVAVGTVEPQRAVYVQYHGVIVAVIEVVSPSNKDRPSVRQDAAARYAGYVRGGINLMLFDLLPLPAGFSFAEEIAADLELPNQPSLKPPFAVVYRVGEPSVSGGRYVAVWRRSLTPGQALPRMVLPLSVHLAVPLDLEATYMQAARSAYLP